MSVYMYLLENGWEILVSLLVSYSNFSEITSIVIWSLKYHNLYTSSQSNNWYLMPESSWFGGWSIWQSIPVYQCWWTGIQGISALLVGAGPPAKVYLSANVGGLVFKASLLYYWGVHLTKYTCLPSFVY